MRRVVLVTGTDSGVGKTLVTAAVARSLKASATTVVAVKPIESGCDPAGSPAEDGVILAGAAGQTSPARALRRYRDPIAPAEAARREGRAVTLEALAHEIGSFAADVTLVEGAGGIFSPLAWDWGHLDLARALDATVLVVAADRLGCLNHTLLTLAAIRQAGLPVLGLVFSAPSQPDASTGGNRALIERLVPEIRIAGLPRLNAADCERAHLDEVAAWIVA